MFQKIKAIHAYIGEVMWLTMPPAAILSGLLLSAYHALAGIRLEKEVEKAVRENSMMRDYLMRECKEIFKTKNNFE